MLGTVEFVLPFIHAKQLRCAGCIQRLTKKFDGQHDHALYWRATRCARPETAAPRLLRGPQGGAIILKCGASQEKPFLATTRAFLLQAGARGMSLRFHLARFTEPAQRMAKPS